MIIRTAGLLAEWAFRLGLAGFILMPAAFGQVVPDAKLKWEIGVHVGGMTADNASGGSAALPEPGTTFTTVNGSVSRRVPSWYFGDGAVLLNQVQAQAPAVAERIIPLDAALTRPLGQRRSKVAFGVSVNRALNARFSAELTVDYAADRVDISPEALSAIRDSRESFYTTWTSFFAAWKSSDPIRTFSVSSSHTLGEKKGGQLLSTGTLTFALRTKGRMIPYLAAGAGVLSRSKGSLAVDLEGSYFTPGFSSHIGNMDSVRLRYETPEHLFTGVAGAGVKYFLTPRVGLRFDARAHLGRGKSQTLISTGGLSFCRICIPGSPVVFGSDPSIQISGGIGPQSLGSALENYPAFSVNTVQRHVVVSLGVFRRF